MSAVPEGLTPLPHADAIGKAMASTFAVALDRFDAAARTWGRVQEYGSRACDDAAIKAEYEEAREALAAFGRHLPGEAASIVRIRVFRMDESCERTTFFVELKTDEGFTMTPCCHRTGSVYTNGEGLSVEEARDRALTEAFEWGDLLRMTVEPYAEDGITYESSFPLETYTTQREIAAERAAAD